MRKFSRPGIGIRGIGIEPADVRLQRPEHIYQFNIDGQTYQQSLVRIDADIDEVIENEIERRRQRLEDFVAQGRILSSDSYGTITLAENGSLDWQRYGSLGSGMVPGWFTGSAQLSFSLYISKDLTVNYEGVLSMTQPGRGISASMNFFYRLANGGLQLEYVPPRISAATS
jgi:hypothetical protein